MDLCDNIDSNSTFNSEQLGLKWNDHPTANIIQPRVNTNADYYRFWQVRTTDWGKWRYICEGNCRDILFVKGNDGSEQTVNALIS